MGGGGKRAKSFSARGRCDIGSSEAIRLGRIKKHRWREPGRDGGDPLVATCEKGSIAAAVVVMFSRQGAWLPSPTRGQLNNKKKKNIFPVPVRA